ncbi:MAG: PAS domain S-box protein [Nitrospirae bacterium]|nr:PAS domain S-box protein [Nitrospirota bacterium]
MSNKTLTSQNQVLSRIRAVNLYHLAGIIILAEIITAVMNTIMGIIWWGRVSYDLIMIGTVDAFVAAVVVGTVVLSIIEHLRETDRRYHELAEREIEELALHESEERFREIFEQNDDALLIISPEAGEIIDVNPAAISLYGYTQQEFIAGGLPLILMPREYEQLRSEVRSVDAAGRLRIARIANRKKDGTIIIASVWGMAVQLKKSKVLFCSFRNITERLRLEEEAKLLQAKLIQTNKMTSLGMLVSGIAHEINNPNHIIMVNAQMVSDAWKDAAEVLSDYYRGHGDFPLGGVPFSEMRYIVPQLLAAMSEGSGRINNMVDNLKDFSKQGRAALGNAVDINKVIAASAALLNNQIQKFTDFFQLREGIDLPPAKGNKQQLEQVVINLIMNALQSLRQRSEAVIVSTLFDEEADAILITVRDEGIGIPQEVLKHITEPFYTTRIDEGGTGLGLSISFSIIKDHQGSLTFLSEPGKGTTATISLPVYRYTTERNRHATAHIS